MFLWICHSNVDSEDMKMPASSQTGFGNLFLERNIRMAAGYQIPVLGCPPGMGQQSHHHHHPLAAMAAVPLAYSGLHGYNFIPYSQHRHINHMSNSFELKAASPYHQALLGRGGGPFYPLYRAGATEDPSSRGANNKVATRESTSALKAWLNEHLKNPYPTKGEKIMLAIVTKMSLTQVSTWFANARRRLKKENRVSWASKGKSDEEDEGESEEEEGLVQKSRLDEDDEEEIDNQALEIDEKKDGTERSSPPPKPLDTRLVNGQQANKNAHKDRNSGQYEEKTDNNKDLDSSKENGACVKPKIWSLAETAISATVSKTKHNSPQQNNGAEVGKWWAEWASRNGIYIPAYSAHDIL